MADSVSSGDVLKDIRKQIPNVRLYKGSDPEVQVQVQSFGVPRSSMWRLHHSLWSE